MAKEDNKSFSKRSGSGSVGGGDTNSSSSRPRPAILDTSNISQFGSSSTMLTAAREKAAGLAGAARDWLQPSWPAPMAHLDSLTTVMFSPLAAHPVYRSESMVKAIQLAQQQQRHSASPTSPSNNSGRSTELVLHNATGSSYPWPSSSVLLKADIPEPTSSLSLFQGFATTYPSLASKSSTKKSKHRKKKQPLEQNALNEKTGSLKHIYLERERKLRESDKLEMQMISTSNEIHQIDMQIDELMNKRKALEAKLTKLETKEQHTQLKIDDLTEKIMDETDQDDSMDGTPRPPRYTSEDESDEEYDFGECFKTLHGHEGNILCVDFDHSKGTLVSSSFDDTIRIWDLRQERCYGQLEGHSNLVRCLQLDDTRLLTGSDDGTLKQWDLSTVAYSPNLDDPPPLDSPCVASFDGHQGEITAMHADYSHLVSGSNDKTMKLWDLETQTSVLTMDVMWASQHSGSHSWSFDNLKMNFFEPSNDYIGALQFWNFALASGTMDGKLRMWDLRTGQVHRTLPGHKGAITALQFDEIHMVSGSADRTIRVWDLRTGSVSDTLTFVDPVSSLQFSSGKIISTTNTDDIDVYNRTSFQHSKLSGHAGVVNTLKYKNHVLASGGKDKVVKLWAM